MCRRSAFDNLSVEIGMAAMTEDAAMGEEEEARRESSLCWGPRLCDGVRGTHGEGEKGVKE